MAVFFFILAVCIVISLALVSYAHCASRQRRKAGQGGDGGHDVKTVALTLPPGSMGWPYLGETFQLYSQDPNVFFASKQKRLVVVVGSSRACPSPSFLIFR
jgi:(+)-abscisic acid 8'-hydroxylase